MHPLLKEKLDELERRLRDLKWEELLQQVRPFVMKHKIFCAVLGAHLLFFLVMIVAPGMFKNVVTLPNAMPVEMMPADQPQQTPSAAAGAEQKAEPPPAEEPEKPKAPETKKPAEPPAKKDEVVLPKNKPEPKAKPEPKKTETKKPAAEKPPVIKPDTSLKDRLRSKLQQAGSASSNKSDNKNSSSRPDQGGQNTSSGLPSVGVEGGNFPYNWYLSLVQAKISSNWNRPTGMLVSEEGLACEVGFRILKDGRIEGVMLLRPSGSEILDSSAVEAVGASDPLPPLPDRFDSGFVDIRIVFNLVK